MPLLPPGSDGALAVASHSTQLGILAVRAIGSGPGAMSTQQAEQRDSIDALSAAPNLVPHVAGADVPLGQGVAIDGGVAAMISELQAKKEAAVRSRVTVA